MKGRFAMLDPYDAALHAARSRADRARLPIQRPFAGEIAFRLCVGCSSEGGDGGDAEGARSPEHSASVHLNTNLTSTVSFCVSTCVCSATGGADGAVRLRYGTISVYVN